MTPKDHKYVDAAVRAMVNSSIEEASETNQRTHDFVIPDTELKEATGRDRLHPQLRQEIIDSFNSCGLSAEYDEANKRTNVTVEFGRVKLSPAQAHHLSIARQSFASNNG
jgi:hypothetical protein